MPTTLPMKKPVPGSSPHELNGRKVLLMFCAFFGVIFAVNGLFMHFAFSTFGGIDAAGAYRKNFLLTKDIIAAEHQSALGWSVNGTVQRSTDNNAKIVVTANDRTGRPIDIRSLEVEFRRPADKRLDGIVSMQRAGSNRFTGSASAITPGQWDVVITLHGRDGERFHSRNRVILK